MSAIAPTPQRLRAKTSLRPTVLLLGEWTHPEYRRLVQWLATQSESWSEANVSTAGALLQEGGNFQPDLILIAQAYAGQWNEADIGSLKSVSPLTPIVVVSGSFSGSQARNGEQLSGLYHLAWHEAVRILSEEFAHWQRGGFQRFALPETLSAEEKFLARLAAPLASGQGLIAIASDDPASGTMLAHLCQSCGYACVVASREGNWQVVGVSAMIWDAADSAEFSALRRRLHEPPTLVLRSFPTVEQQNHFLQAGASEVFGKPFDIAELSQALHRLTGKAEDAPEQSPIAAREPG